MSNRESTYADGWHLLVNCRSHDSCLYGTNVPGGVLLILGNSNAGMKFIPNSKIIRDKDGEDKLVADSSFDILSTRMEDYLP